MHDIFMFVAGIVFTVFALPVLQTISDTFVTLGQWLLSVFNLHIVRNNSIIQSYQNPFETQAIGFQAPDEEYYDEDDEPDEKLKIGFRG
mgnify:FL=1